MLREASAFVCAALMAEGEHGVRPGDSSTCGSAAVAD